LKNVHELPRGVEGIDIKQFMTPLNFEEFDHCFKKELVSSEESRGIVKVQKVGRPAISKNKFA
jgi:hypothetical protein